MRIRLRVSFIAIALQWYAHGLGAEEVIVYCSVNDLLARAVAERFEKETGIPVRLVPESRQAEGGGLSDRLIAETNRPQADVLWSNDPVSAVILKSERPIGALRIAECEKPTETVQRSRTSLDRLPGSRSSDSLQQGPT